MRTGRSKRRGRSGPGSGGGAKAKGAGPAPADNSAIDSPPPPQLDQPAPNPFMPPFSAPTQTAPPPPPPAPPTPPPPSAPDIQYQQQPPQPGQNSQSQNNQGQYSQNWSNQNQFSNQPGQQRQPGNYQGGYQGNNQSNNRGGYQNQQGQRNQQQGQYSNRGQPNQQYQQNQQGHRGHGNQGHHGHHGPQQPNRSGGPHGQQGQHWYGGRGGRPGGGGGGGQHHGNRPHQPAPPAGIQIAGFDPSTSPIIKPFDEVTTIDPQPRYTLEYEGCPESCRLIDLFCPVGRGQRALIVSPPKAGKTTLLKDIAGAIAKNYPDVYIIGLLVDERPEEVTDFRRTFQKFGNRADGSPIAQVIASSNDHGIEKHVAVSLQTIAAAKRMVEAGKHVVIVLDSLTRLGRAFNLSRQHASSGRTLSGGLDARALEVPKQIFGSARNTDEAGSLTIIASCLVDTGSLGDQVIFEEFKGTGNMELILDRKISERRLFPAINLAASGTRKENLLMPEQEFKTVTALRRRLISMPPHVQIEQLMAAMKRFKTNAELVGSAS